MAKKKPAASDEPNARQIAEAQKKVDELTERGGWPLVMAMRELNGWTSGYYDNRKD